MIRYDSSMQDGDIHHVVCRGYTANGNCQSQVQLITTVCKRSHRRWLIGHLYPTPFAMQSPFGRFLVNPACRSGSHSPVIEIIRLPIQVSRSVKVNEKTKARVICNFFSAILEAATLMRMVSKIDIGHQFGVSLKVSNGAAHRSLMLHRNWISCIQSTIRQSPSEYTIRTSIHQA